MSKNKLFVISAVLLILAIAIPIGLSCLGENALNVVDSVSALIGAFCGIITLLIAILLYNKYGVDQTITDKNLKVVLDIVEELKKTKVIAWSDSKSGSYVYQLNFWTTDLNEFSESVVRNTLDDPIYFKISYAYAFDRLFELSQEPFAPKEVSDAIKGIQLYMLSEIKIESLTGRYAVISVRTNELVENEEMIGKFNNKDMTLREYIQNFQKVKESIKTWLLSHNVDSSSLNF
jgi:hypothetical protein